MSRFVQGNCVEIMAGFPDKAVDFILTDPPYLVGFRDRQGRTIAGDVTDEWLQPACNEMYRVLKKDALMVSFYGWNRIDRFMAAWKSAGFSVVGHPVLPSRQPRSSGRSPAQVSRSHPPAPVCRARQAAASLAPLYLRPIARLVWMHGTARCRGICDYGGLPCS